MKLKINIIKHNPCELFIEDLSPYVLENSESRDEYDVFAVPDRVGIDVIQRNQLTETSITEYSVSTGIEPIKINPEFDGWVTIHHIMIPTYEWVQRNLEKETSVLSLYNVVYFYKDHHFYKLIKDISNNAYSYEEVLLEELVEVNTYKTSISKFSQNFVFLCKLEQCYANYCKQIMEKGCAFGCTTKKDLEELYEKRDWVWMTINVINYLIEFGQFEEAERIIETTGGCNGLCEQQTRTAKTSGGCGCSAKA